MKKILPLILLAGVGFLAYSCDNSNDDPVVVNPGKDNDTFPIMMDAPGSFTAANNYALTADISIQTTDVVLVYRRAGNAWQQIPKTVYVDPATSVSPRKFDYNFVFSNKEVQVRIDDQNFNLASMSSAEANNYLNNQTFRIVLVPADPAKKMARTSNSVDFGDYNAVVKYYNLDESKIKTIGTH
ncbi:hypothetical protein PYS58_18750 [Chryseobacterium indologenes]|uniref:hypothetical protein n=1 Tax=Chryseobacterium TaxID=59732 RepID=UPI0016290079|nr:MULTISPECIES: hypothetical protein [Chryseobacterium]MDM1557471.1 hypothetical protein [Chryseobacterium indologenes]WET48595.1 hypothetical protein PYS58_18750 [Chryseobacterium indologenes]